MKIFAITGGIGCGKSTITKIIESTGIPIVDADKIATEVRNIKRPELLLAFPDAFIDDQLDRQKLADIIYTNNQRRLELESILHPAIKELAKLQFQKLEEKGTQLAGYDIPLLFETRQESEYRPIITIWTDFENQVSRVMKRSNWTREDAERRILDQIPIEYKIQNCDYPIENNGTLDELTANTLKVLAQIKETINH